MSIRADLGLPPYDVLLSAIREALGITLGQAGWVRTGRTRRQVDSPVAVD